MLALWMYFWNEQTWLDNPAAQPPVFGGVPREHPFFSYSEKKLAVRPKPLPVVKPEPEPVPSITAVAVIVQAAGFCYAVAEIGIAAAAQTKHSARASFGAVRLGMCGLAHSEQRQRMSATGETVDVDLEAIAAIMAAA